MNKKATLQISGMDCASCAAVIEHDLKKIKGVNSANVNFATEKAYVDIDTDQTDIDKIKKTIEDLGYKAADDTAEEMLMEGGHDHHKMVKEYKILCLLKKLLHQRNYLKYKQINYYE